MYLKRRLKFLRIVFIFLGTGLISSITIAEKFAFEFTQRDFTLLLSNIALLATLFVLAYSELFNQKRRIEDNEIRFSERKEKQVENEIRHIEDSINLFYIPLQNLLTIYDEDMEDMTKLKTINEINGHKHLAEPRVRFLFENYIQKTKGESDRVSGKLLELVCRDIELLHNQLMKLKES